MLVLLLACSKSQPSFDSASPPLSHREPNESSATEHPLFGSWALDQDQPYGRQTLINPVLSYGPSGFMLSADEGINNDGSVAFQSFATCGGAQILSSTEESTMGIIETSPLNVIGGHTMAFRNLEEDSVVFLNDTDGDGVYETEQPATRLATPLILQFEHPYPTLSQHLIVEITEVAKATPSESGQLEYRACRAEDLQFKEENGSLTIQDGVDFLGQKPLLRLPQLSQITTTSDLQLLNIPWPKLTIEGRGNSSITLEGSIEELTLVGDGPIRIDTLQNPARIVEVHASASAVFRVSASERLQGSVNNATLEYQGEPIIDIQSSDDAIIVPID